MEKLDLTKAYKPYYSAKNKPELLHIEPAQFLSVTGKGDPSGPEFANRVQALYATAYTIKFQCKATGRDFVVAKLEGLWSFDENQYAAISMEEAPLLIPRSEWSYRMLIRMPDYVSAAQVTAAVQSVVEKKQLPLARAIELYQMAEGKSVQMLHIGPFANEPETLKQMKEFIEAHKLQKNGLHHEIYLSDFNKTAPGKLKTILREPVQ